LATQAGKIRYIGTSSSQVFMPMFSSFGPRNTQPPPCTSLNCLQPSLALHLLVKHLKRFDKVKHGNIYGLVLVVHLCAVCKSSGFHSSLFLGYSPLSASLADCFWTGEYETSLIHSTLSSVRISLPNAAPTPTPGHSPDLRLCPKCSGLHTSEQRPFINPPNLVCSPTEFLQRPLQRRLCFPGRG
jgi:hypothetical protein